MSDKTERHGSLTAEELQLALDAGREIARITVALEQLSTAYGNKAVSQDNPADVFDGIYSTKLYTGLQKRREELRGMLLDIG